MTNGQTPAPGRIAGIIEGREGAAAGVLIAALLALAWAHRFVQDDAFISFRYARNLVDGIGLCWNPGERVEGYTNFLWTLLVALGLQLGADPVPFTQALGLSLFASSLVIAWGLARSAGLGATASLAALLLTGANFTYSSYATGGLETPLVTAIFLAGLLVTARVMTGGLERGRGLLALSVLLTAGILTRIDTAVLFAGPLLTLFVGGSVPRDGMGRRIVDDLARIALIPVVCVGCWLAWKYSYYGGLLPRAFYLKAVNASSLERGFRYFYEFIVSYDLAPFLFFCIFFFGAIFRRENRVQLMMAATATLWFSYVLKVGGDFMEFRFMAPVIPPMMILLVWLLFSCAVKTWLRAAGLLLVLGGSLHHAATFSYDYDTGIEPVGMLRGHLYAPGEHWVGIGKALAAAFRPSDGVVIATTAAGAIPYYSGLRSVDMLGLNEPPAVKKSPDLASAGGETNLGDTDGRSADAWNRGEGVGAIDERSRGVLVSDIPGHQRVLTYEYLNARGVNLVLSHPVVTRVGEPAGALPLLPTSGPPHLNARVIRMPIGDGYQVEMLYIRPNPAVDSALARHGWPARTVVF